MNGRIYDPLLGRFLSADIVVQAPENLQAFNRYSYVFNNPLSFTDPSGFETEDERRREEEAREARWQEIKREYSLSRPRIGTWASWFAQTSPARAATVAADTASGKGKPKANRATDGAAIEPEPPSGEIDPEELTVPEIDQVRRKIFTHLAPKPTRSGEHVTVDLSVKTKNEKDEEVVVHSTATFEKVELAIRGKKYPALTLVGDLPKDFDGKYNCYGYVLGGGEVDPERETAGTGWLVMDRTGKVNT